MDKRAADIVRRLKLQPHPEGGYFSEIYRSPAAVMPQDARGGRAALTIIYYLLAAGDYSRWHRVRSDEVWHFHGGDPLELIVIREVTGEPESVVLGPLGGEGQPVAVVPAGCWQAGRSRGAYTLAACVVAPGFEYDDFGLMAASEDEADELRRNHPGLADLL